ncbi:MAG TPA: hypothetical protein VJL88_08720 [Nitrospira sp.]|nr:hypothetical protein [Nitrospira sp.]
MTKWWLRLLILTACTIVSSPLIAVAQQEDKSASGGSSQSSQTQGKRVTGQLTHIEGWHYTIKESSGEEVSFGVTSATQDPHKVKEGDHIVAMIGEDRIALSIKNMKVKN